MAARFLYFALIFAIFCHKICCAFNVDTDSAIIAHVGQRNSLFGQTLYLNESTLYVGAPKHNTKGNIFRCDFNFNLNTPSCSPLDNHQGDRLRDV